MTDITETILDPRRAPTQHVVVLQTLHAAPLRAAELAARLPAEAHDWQVDPDTWSARMLAAHLAGAEAPFLKRFQTIVNESDPWLAYIGPTVARPDAPGTLPALLDQFRRERQVLVRLLVDLKPADWERPALHQTLGPTTLALQVQNLANHDAEHIQQLGEVVQAWERRAHA